MAVLKHAVQVAVPTEDEMKGLIRIIEDRMKASDLGEINIQLDGNQLLIQLVGVSDISRAKNLIGEPGRLEFKHRKMNVSQDLGAELVIVSDDVMSVSAEPIPQELLNLLAPTGTGTLQSMPEDFPP